MKVPNTIKLTPGLYLVKVKGNWKLAELLDDRVWIDCITKDPILSINIQKVNTLKLE